MEKKILGFRNMQEKLEKVFYWLQALKYTQKTSRDLFELFVFFNLYMTSENIWHLCTNHGWFWIQFTVNCAFEIMIKILCHWTVTKRPMNLRMNLLHTCDVMYNLYTSQLLPKIDTVLWSIFCWFLNPFWFFELKFHT